MHQSPDQAGLHSHVWRALETPHCSVGILASPCSPSVQLRDQKRNGCMIITSPLHPREIIH